VQYLPENLHKQNKRTKKLKKRTINKIYQISLSKKLFYYEKFDLLIRAKKTGTTEELAQKFSITTALAHDIIFHMINELNCPIEYCELDESYHYRRKGKLILGFLSE